MPERTRVKGQAGFYSIAFGTGVSGRHRSVQRLFLQQTSRAETECLKMSCSWVFVSSTMEYLSNERTFPETFAPFSRWTVMCFPPASAMFRNDSCTLITDMFQMWPKTLPARARPLPEPWKAHNQQPQNSGESSICPIYN